MAVCGSGVTRNSQRGGWWDPSRFIASLRRPMGVWERWLEVGGGGGGKPGFWGILFFFKTL